MTASQVSLFPSRTVTEFIEDVKNLTQEIQDLYCSDNIPWVIGVSWGKDSTTVLQLVWNAIAILPPEKRHKTIHVITTDTLVENPIVAAWVKKSIKKLEATAQKENIPIEPHLLLPDVKARYWVSLIGKGYPAPRSGFRWCTDRLKIQPTNDFIRRMIRSSEKVLIVLGTRKAESSKRAASMAKHEMGHIHEQFNINSNLKNNLHYSGSLPNAIIYSPVQDWRTDEVWMYLMQWENPWGGNNKDLFALYRGATADNECPLVVDTSTPSCGDSRFGCWVCTLVNQDKSMAAMIQNDEDKEWLQPLIDIRNELDIYDDRDKRDFRRLYGKVQLFERNLKGEISIEPIPGPYTKQAREYWLKRVLEAQVQVRNNAPDEYKDITLITPEELSEIRRIWLEEKHEFDDSLPKIYEEVTGEPYQDTRLVVSNHFLGSDEWDILADICEEDTMHLELMAKLLDTERQFYAKSHRVGIYRDLEKCFESSSRQKEDAIDNAHLQRNLKNSSQEGNVDEFKGHLNREQASEEKQVIQQPPKEEDTANKQLSLSWANLKYPSQPEEE